ncbi:hypothetical protein L7F22_009919 [Adiantum nelumboides]|nr:hypothetical protein [Adiantum nelumboides]
MADAFMDKLNSVGEHIKIEDATSETMEGPDCEKSMLIYDMVNHDASCGVDVVRALKKRLTLNTLTSCSDPHPLLVENVCQYCEKMFSEVELECEMVRAVDNPLTATHVRQFSHLLILGGRPQMSCGIFLFLMKPTRTHTCMQKDKATNKGRASEDEAWLFGVWFFGYQRLPFEQGRSPWAAEGRQGLAESEKKSDLSPLQSGEARQGQARAAFMGAASSTWLLHRVHEAPHEACTVCM